MQQIAERQKLEEILGRVMQGEDLNKEEILLLLSLCNDEDIDRLFHSARKMRSRYFSNTVFLYGFLYFNTECSNNCLFCQYRKSNVQAVRYRKTTETVNSIIHKMEESGVNLIDLTMGELADGTEEARSEYQRLETFIRAIRKESDIPVMVSPGYVNFGVLVRLAAAGADWYACYQETYKRELFDQVRPGQGFNRRYSGKLKARELGMHVEEGMLIGLGETLEDRAKTILGMKDLGADQVRVMTLVPHPDTPLGQLEQLPEIEELKTIAVMRLLMPDRLIPASLDVGGLAGLRHRLDAGANVITSLIVPGMGLSGVANETLDIDQARRTPQAIMPILAECGLEVGSTAKLRKWLQNRDVTAVEEVD